MPAENLAEEGLLKNPDLQLSQWKFVLGTEKYKNDPQIKNQLMSAVTKDSKLSWLSYRFKVEVQLLLSIDCFVYNFTIN